MASLYLWLEVGGDLLPVNRDGETEDASSRYIVTLFVPVPVQYVTAAAVFLCVFTCC